MQQHQSRKFQAQGDSWIARRQVPSPEDKSAYTGVERRQRRREPGIWFQSQKGKFRFLRQAGEEGFPDETEFMMLSGIQLARLLGRAVTM